jgi:phosphate-selective porin OprO and OprP
MRLRRLLSEALVLAFAVVAPASAQTAWPDPDALGAAARVRGTGPGATQQEGQTKQQEEKTKKDAKKKPKDEGLRFVWDDRPSLRAGKWLRVDFRLKVQADVRTSQQDLTDYGGTFDLSRLRGGVKGEVTKYVEFEVEHDLESNGQWRDTYLNFRPLREAQFKAGKFKIPFSLEQTTGPTELDFVYRSLAATDLAPGRDVGGMAHGSVLKRSLHYEVGYFQGDGDNPPSLKPMPYPLPEDPPAVYGPSWAGRVRAEPFRALGKKSLLETLEFGVAATSTDIPVGPNHLQGQSVFGFDFFSRLYYTNGPRKRLGFEFSWLPGPASVKFEYVRTTEARVGQGMGNESSLDNDLPEIVGRGWYISGTWVVTGEKKDGGVVPRKPLFQGGFGAIEVAGRYEGLRFASASEAEAPSWNPRAATVEANEDKVLTLGATWYLNRWVKIQANLIQEKFADPERSPIPGQSTVKSFVLRFQFVM